MKNSQVAMICATILAAALINAVGQIVLIQSLRHDGSGREALPSAAGGLQPVVATSPAPRSSGITVAMMPKSKGNSYFIACRKGAEEAARELGVKLIWDGPTDPDPAKQNEVVDTWITRGVDVIAVAVENRDGISSVLKKARDRGIKVLTWDADANPEARDFFVNQATPEGIGQTLMDNAARVLENKGSFAIITASLTAANMIAWQKTIEARRKEKYPNIKMAALRPCDDLQKKAFDEATTVMNSDPEVKLFMAICTPAVPGAAEAVKQSGRTDVKVIGLGLPNDNKRYVHDGITDCVILWNTMDLGYLTVQAAIAPQGRNAQARRHEVHIRPAGLGRDRRRQYPARPALSLHQGQHRQIRFLSVRFVSTTAGSPSQCCLHSPRKPWIIDPALARMGRYRAGLGYPDPG